MTEHEPADRLSTKRQFVLVVRLVVDVDGKVTAEIVDPVSERRQRFADVARLLEAVRGWIDDARGTAMRDFDQLFRKANSQSANPPQSRNRP